MRLFALIAILSTVATAGAQTKRILYVTHSAGYRHDCLPVSAEQMKRAATEAGDIEVTATEDLSLLTAASLRSYDAVFFYTSGELAISDSQKRDLLDFVRSGKGFGGAHSATDTFYSWPEYGDLIGAWFNGHPWVQKIRIDVEDPGHPAAGGLGPGWEIVDEIYQFREFSREKTRVLMTLDASTVNLGAAGVNPGTEDFPLAWVKNYGTGRVFYTALGHFEETWRDPQFAAMLRGALRWLTGLAPGDAGARPPKKPDFAREAVANSAGFEPRGVVAPGSLITVFGSNLSPGAAVAAADSRRPVFKLGGTTVKLGGRALPLLFSSPGQMNAYVPAGPAGADAHLEITSAGLTGSAEVTVAASAAGIFTYTARDGVITLWGTGFGPTETRGGLEWTRTSPSAMLAGRPTRVLFSGLAPGWLGLYQIDLEMPADLPRPALIELTFGDFAWQARY